jgi:hypothetical protein
LELVDQAQAHKRKVVKIAVSNDYVFTASFDQRVKQWSLSSLTLVSSFSFTWIPASLTVENSTMLVGGSSVVSTVRLQYYDLQELRKKTGSVGESSIKKKNASDQSISGGGSNVIIVTFTVISVLIVTISSYMLYAYGKKKATDSTPKVDSTSITDLETLVTSILKIAVPGYKEITASEFRTINIIAKGGGGEVYMGEILSKKGKVEGKQVVVKKISGKDAVHFYFRKFQ